MSSFYLMPSGKMPMLNGNPVLITQEEFEECCCEPSLVELTHCNDSASDLCDGSESSIITELGASYVGKVVRVAGVCYSVAEVESGTPVAVTVDDVYDDCAECCGDLAPCSCPCTSWPGAYPWGTTCNGLFDEYENSNNLTSDYDSESIYLVDWSWSSGLSRWVKIENRKSQTIKAISSMCEWRGTVQFRVLQYLGTEFGGPTSIEFVSLDWTNSTATVELDGSDCSWRFNPGIGGSLNLESASKRVVGQTPAGRYAGVYVSPSNEYEIEQIDTTLSEPAP